MMPALWVRSAAFSFVGKEEHYEEKDNFSALEMGMRPIVFHPELFFADSSCLIHHPM